jgi:hypothetical protein
LTLVTCALCLLVIGCSSGRTSGDGSTGGSGPIPARQRLVESSTADAHVVQPQPPPGSCHAAGTGAFSLPDPSCTPGAIDPSVTQGNIRSTICRSGYTATVRPPESVTRTEKAASIAAYRGAGSPENYEYDHLVPLELGGARNDPRNLWPEPGASPNVKDELEGRLRELACAGTVTLRSAQLQIATDWVAAYHRLVG